MALVLRSYGDVALPQRQNPGESATTDSEPDLKIERMVAEISALIRSAAPERRGELKELTEALLRDEISSIPESFPATEKSSAAKSSNPLFAGILLTLFGLGFSLLFPLVGAALAVIGLGLTIWGIVLSSLKR